MSSAVPIKPRLPGAARGETGRGRRPQAWGRWWLAGVALAFTVAQLIFVVPHLALSWDEVVYISQVSGHAPAAYFDPARARGIPLLVAPVTLLTSSVLILRSYLAIASGLGLLGCLAVWQGLRPAWQLALAGLFFGSLWTAQYYGPQAMPDEWVAFSAVAAAGFFLHAAQAHGRGRQWRLAGLAVSLAIAALVRPGDALYLGAAFLLAIGVVRAWRQVRLFLAVAAGFAAGAAEWVAEAWLRFGGPLARLREAGAEQGGFGLHLGLWDELKAVNGPTLCRPCTIGLRYPELSLWWLALPLLVVLGVLAGRQAGRMASAVLAAGCALALAFQYLFLVGYAAPRFLLPAYALAAIPVADAAGWLITRLRDRSRVVALGLLAVALVAQLEIQNTVLRHQVTEKEGYFAGYAAIAADLRGLGVRPPCLVKGEQDIPIAYYAGCASAGQVPAARAAEPVAVLVPAGRRPPDYAAGWVRHNLPGVHARLLALVAYVRPGQR